MNKQDITYKSSDGKSTIYATEWLPSEGNPRAVVQIIHGMAEHIARYDELAKYLTMQGYVVVGEDHLGHGLTAVNNNAKKGYFAADNPGRVIVRDIRGLHKVVRDKYPNIPYIMLGHSMGSFMLRNYIMGHGDEIDGCILSGSGVQPRIMCQLSKILTGVVSIFTKEDEVSKFLNVLAFLGFNKRIKDCKTPVDWLSLNEDNVKRYLEDELCGFTFTLNGFRGLFFLIDNLNNKLLLEKIPKKLPILLFGGGEDPVGGYGKGLKSIENIYKGLGISDVRVIIYDESRHEVLNDVDKDKAMTDIGDWIRGILE